MSEEFAVVEKTEDHICDIMELFCEVQAEICEEMKRGKDQFPDALDDDYMSATNRSNAH